MRSLPITNERGVQDLGVSLLEVVPKVLYQFDKLEAFHTFNQLSLQCRPASSDNEHLRLTESCGSFYRQGVSLKDTDFTALVPEFEFLKDTTATIDALTGMTTSRLRVMSMPPKSCLSYHVDAVPYRWHLPLKTSANAMFIVEDLVYRMPFVGRLYLIKTAVKHTAVNASFDDTRIHLVGSLT